MVSCIFHLDIISAVQATLQSIMAGYFDCTVACSEPL